MGRWLLNRFVTEHKTAWPEDFETYRRGDKDAVFRWAIVRIAELQRRLLELTHCSISERSNV